MGGRLRYSATASSRSWVRWPLFWCWAARSAAIHAERCRPGGNFATQWSISWRECSFSSFALPTGAAGCGAVMNAGEIAELMSRLSVLLMLLIFWASAIHFPEHDVLRADDGDDVREHVPANHLVQRREMHEAGRAALQAIRLVRAVRHEIDAEFTLRCFDRRVGVPDGDAVPLGEELEVMDERFHVALHLLAARRAHLAIVDHHRSWVGLQPLHALADDAGRLAHLFDAHEIAVVAVPVHADRYVEIHAVVDFVRLFLAQVPRDAGATDHRACEPELKRALRSDHADVHRALFPDAVVGEQRLVIV